MIYASRSAEFKREGRPRIGWSRRWIGCAVMALGVLVVAAGAISPSATAGSTTIPDRSGMLQNWQTRACLEYLGGFVAVPIMKTCESAGPLDQRWGLYRADPKDGSPYRIRNEESTHCLVLIEKKHLAALAGPACEADTAWWWVDEGVPEMRQNGTPYVWGERVQIHSVAVPGCLDANDAGLSYYNTECNGGLYQRWSLSPALIST